MVKTPLKRFRSNSALSLSTSYIQHVIDNLQRNSDDLSELVIIILPITWHSYSSFSNLSCACLEHYWICTGAISAVNAIIIVIGAQSRDLMSSGLT